MCVKCVLGRAPGVTGLWLAHLTYLVSCCCRRPLPSSPSFCLCKRRPACRTGSARLRGVPPFCSPLQQATYCHMRPQPLRAYGSVAVLQQPSCHAAQDDMLLPSAACVLRRSLLATQAVRAYGSGAMLPTLLAALEPLVS